MDIYVVTRHVSGAKRTDAFKHCINAMALANKIAETHGLTFFSEAINNDVLPLRIWTNKKGTEVMRMEGATLKDF